MALQVDPGLVEAVVRRVLAEGERPEDREPVVPVGVSNRHVHLSREHMDILFGPGRQLTPMRELMGGEYAAREQVTIAGPSLRPIERVRVLGPLRERTQIEISRTDSYLLKVPPVVRPSGDHRGTPGLVLVGPAGTVRTESGCIVANRHIHMSPADAARMGLSDGDLVDCLCEGERRSLFYGVQVRVAPSFTLEMHMDTDDANAVGFGDYPVVKLLLRQ